MFRISYVDIAESQPNMNPKTLCKSKITVERAQKGRKRLFCVSPELGKLHYCLNFENSKY